MTRTLHRTLFVAVAIATSIPTAVVAQPAGATRAAGDTPADALTPQEREVLTAAEQLASDASQLVEQWITTQAITEDRVFGRLYFPIAKTDPQKYASPYDALAERDLVGPEDKTLARSATLVYAIVTDL